MSQLPYLSALDSKTRKLHEAVIEFSDKQGVNAATVATITQKFVAMLASRWVHICDVAGSEDEEGKVAVAFRLALDFSGKNPCGSITLSFSQKTTDDDAFIIEDPAQTALAFVSTDPIDAARIRKLAKVPVTVLGS